jgi:hypothetical protein
MYRFKIPPKKEYGEFECPYCKKPYFNKTSLAGHVGGAHRRFTIQKDKRPRCKFCENELIEGKNWPKWAIKQQNLICQKCKRKQNRLSYYKARAAKAENREKHQIRLKKILAKRKEEKLNET